MRKKAGILFFILMLFVLVSCTDNKNNDGDKDIDPVVETFVVSFNSDGGTTIANQTIEKGKIITEPENPIKSGFIFEFWYVDDVTKPFDFTTPVTANITLNAFYKTEEVIDVVTEAEMLDEDFEEIMTNLYLSDNELNIVKKGKNGSTISWTIQTDYISNEGIIAPLIPGDETESGAVKLTFRLNNTVLEKIIQIPLSPVKPVEIATTRNIPFVNMTTEYNVKDKVAFSLYFEEDGSVPYVKLKDYLDLLDGFIDYDTYEFDYDIISEDELSITYEYYDEEQDYTYILTVVVNATENTLTTNDPAFYWAYVYSTETNYGRNIEYERDYPGTHSTEGIDIVYDLDDFNMDIVLVDGEITLPFYVANQLFAGSSYYNVYYNHDKLIGIYALPDPESDADAYNAIRTSSMNNKKMPVDLVIHNFNYLAFALDHFYGLKDINEVESYYPLLFKYKNKLLTATASTFDVALNNIIVEEIDELHTSYGYPGYYNRKTYGGPSASYYDFKKGSRIRTFYDDGLIAVDKQISSKWNVPVPSGYLLGAYNDSNRPLFWFLDTEKTYAVLSLDNFSTSDIEEDTFWDYTFINEILEIEVEEHVPSIANGTKYFYYNLSTQTTNAVEVLIKGMSEEEYADYVEKLLNNDFVYSQVDEHYQKVVGDSLYLVNILFDNDYHATLVSVSVVPNESFDSLFNKTVFDAIISDSAVYMEFQIERVIRESGKLEGIVLDLTMNTGGNVGALYRVVGFITDQSFGVNSMDGDTKSASTGYVKIVNTPSYGSLDWGLLVSHATFSAANSMTAIFKFNDLGPIMGMPTGGGASSITPILLPSGTAFTMSSNNISAIRSGDSEVNYVYESIEFGVTPDHILDIRNIFNNDMIYGIMNNQVE